MGVMLGYFSPLLFLTLFATANLFIRAVNGGACTKFSQKSTLLIVFGDSFFDVGYGNDELCLPSTFPPYGKSLKGSNPTGRFSDGLVLPDYIAQYLGLANQEGKVAAYTESFDIQQQLQGQGASLSFAMAGGGITQSPDKPKSLDKQVEIFLANSGKFFDSGAKFENKQDQTVYLFSIGTSDYLSNLHRIKNKEVAHEAIADEVTTAIVEQVRRIAEGKDVNGKRFAFMSVALRYLPVVLNLYHEDQSLLDLLKELETAHYEKLREKLEKLVQDLQKATGEDHRSISYSILQYHSIINAIMEAPEKYGFDKTTVTSACCGDGSYKADGCGHSDENGCSDPTAYVFWDGMHNTQHINQELARRFWNGPRGTTYPQNLQALAGTQKPQYHFSVNANELTRIQTIVTIIETRTITTSARKVT